MTELLNAESQRFKPQQNTPTTRTVFKASVREPGDQERKAFGLGLGSEQHGCRKGDRTGPDRTRPHRNTQLAGG